MKKMMSVVLFAAVLVMACATTPAVRTSDAPLPTDITIVPADPNLPAAKFLGRWFGRWDGVMDHYLIVSQALSDEKVLALYSWGSGYGASPGYVWVRGDVKDKTLTLSWLDRVVIYKLTKEGSLAATYSRAGGNYSTAILKRE